MAEKRIIKSFNVHGLVRVRFESCLQAKLRQIMHNLAEFEDKTDHQCVPNIELRDYADAPDLVGKAVIPGFCFYAEGYLNIPSYRLCFDLAGVPIKVFSDQLLVPISLLIHLALLPKDYSFIHSAAVEFEGRRYLFPAFGGIGKTTLVAAIVFAGGRLYGDDMNIVGHNEVLSYPQDFSVYPYHVALLRLNDRKIMRDFKRTAMLDRITNGLERFNSRPAKLARVILNSLKVPCVNVAPRSIFGDQCFAKRGVIDEVYYLSRAGDEAKGLVITRTDPVALAEVCTNILFHEWHQSLRYLYLYSALSPFSVEEMYRNTMIVLERLFTTRSCYVVEIPQSMANAEFQRELLQLLRKRGKSLGA